jgi:hypothetical protein
MQRKFWPVNLKGKKPLGRTSSTLKDNIRMDVKEK